MRLTVSVAEGHPTRERCRAGLWFTRLPVEVEVTEEQAEAILADQYLDVEADMREPGELVADGEEHSADLTDSGSEPLPQNDGAESAGEDDGRDESPAAPEQAPEQTAPSTAAPQTCAGTTRAGNPCKSRPVEGSKYCAAHKPE